MRKMFAAACMICVMLSFFGVSAAHATLAGMTYSAFANDNGLQQISTIGNVSSGDASASVALNAMSAGYTGPVAGSGAGAGTFWTAPADTTFRVVFDYAITNPYNTLPKSQNTSFQVYGLNPITYDEPFNFITYSGSGHFDQTLSLQAGEQLSIMVNALGPDGQGGLSVNLSNLDVSAVPIPAAIYLLGPTMLGMVGLRRRFLG